MSHDTVVQELSGSLVAMVEVRFTARLEYHVADPFAVRMLFDADRTVEGVPTAWTFARQLLGEGLRAPAGRGDVRIRPDGPDTTAIDLRTRADCTLLVVRTADLRAFLAATERLVPFGTEGRRISWSRVLAELTRES